MDRAVTLGTEGTAGPRERTPARRLLQGAVPYVLSTVAVALALLGALTLERNGLHPPVFGMFLFAIASTVWYPGVGPAIVAVVLSVVTFEYYFVEPRYSFSIAPTHVPYFIAFVLSVVTFEYYFVEPRYSFSIAPTHVPSSSGSCSSR